jgi:hypothetical protein
LYKMSVSHDKLVLPDGLNYRLLVVPNQKDIPVKVMEKLKKMIAAGANVLFQNSDAMPKDLTAYNLRDISIDEALNKLAVSKDFTGDSDKLDFIHRKTASGDIYFVRNKTDMAIEEECLFRTIGNQVEFWDPVTGGQYQVKDVSTFNGDTKVKLQLAPYASCFIMFNSAIRRLPEYKFLTIYLSSEIKEPWLLSFPKNWGAPDSVKLTKLISWTDHPDEGVKYFSGTASYTNSFDISAKTLEKDSIVNINLGDVLDVAKVLINGKPVGVLWTPPYKLNIKDYLKTGRNSLEIQVTNMWINRLTGDMNSTDGKKYCQTNIPYILTDRTSTSDEKFHVQRAGLIGPVFLESIRFALRN